MALPLDSQTPKSVRLLLVEDNAADVRLVCETFRDSELQDAEVRSVDRLQKALSLLEKEPFDLVLLDLNLPDSIGLGTFSHLREKHPDQAIVVLTGDSDETVGLDAVRAGAQDYLVKGGDSRLLVRSIQYALERKRSLQALSSSENRFRKLVENSSDAIMLIDAGNRVLYVSESIQQLLGYTAAEFERMDLWTILHPDDVESMRARLGEALLQPETLIPVTHRMRHKDGSWRHFESVGKNNLSDPDVGAIVVNIRDVTWLRQSEWALRESEARFRTLMEQASDAIFVVDAQGILLDVNSRTCTLTGYRQDELLQNRIHRFLPEEALPATRDGMERMRKGEHILLETLFRSKEGKLIDVEVSARMLADGSFLSIARDITQRKRMERELKASEQRFRRVFESELVGIVFWRHDGAFTDANDVFLRMIGHTREDLKQGRLSGRQITAPEYLHFYDSDGEHLCADGVGQVYEKEYIRKDGSRIPVLIRTAILDATKESGVAIVLDLRQQKEALAALRQSEENYRKLFNAANDLMIIFEPGQHNILEVNDKACKTFGYAREEILGQSLDMLCNSNCNNGSSLEELLERRASANFESICRSRDGRELHMLCSTSLVEYQGSLAVLSIQRDMTEWKQAEEKLRQSEWQFHTVFDSSLDAMIVADDAAAVVDANPAAMKLLSCTRDFLLQHALAEFSDSFAPSSIVWQEFLAQGWNREEMQLRLADGSMRHVSCSATANFIPGRHLMVLHDMTEHYSLQRQLQQAQKMEAVGRLAGGVAHDFNNLLSVISGYAELAREKLPPASPLRRNLDNILGASRKAAGLTRQLLAFSRMQVLSPRRLDVNAVLSDLSKLLPRLIGEDIELRTACEPALDYVLADPVQIEQVILNLAVNARDAMPTGGSLSLMTRNLAVLGGDSYHLRGVKPGKYVLLVTRDTGVGMSSDVQTHIFEPFFTTKEQGKGTGLGLSTVYGIVHQSNGHILVESVPDQGTTFEILLPGIRRTEDSSTVVADETHVAMGLVWRLLVEDEEELRAGLHEILESFGYAVLAARNGIEALQLARTHQGPIQLLVTDIVMPKLGGRNWWNGSWKFIPGCGYFVCRGTATTLFFTTVF